MKTSQRLAPDPLPPAATARREIAMLKELFARQQAYCKSRGILSASMDYIQSKFAMDITLERQLRIIDMIAGLVHGRVLEWGCHHGLDGCVFRSRFQEEIELYSCDVLEEDMFKPLYEFSRTIYTRVRHPYKLDYNDNFFDVVLSNGVLEHVPDDRRSIQEIGRILKVGGLFIITCLPNRYSYTEAVQRWRKGPAHGRLYTVGSATQMLTEAGFEVIHTKYFFMVPTMLNGFPRQIQSVYQKADRLVWLMNDLLEHMWPANRLSSNLLLIAKKS